jgi:MoxR-like ATPase
MQSKLRHNFDPLDLEVMERALESAWAVVKGNHVSTEELDTDEQLEANLRNASGHSLERLAALLTSGSHLVARGPIPSSDRRTKDRLRASGALDRDKLPLISSVAATSHRR